MYTLHHVLMYKGKIYTCNTFKATNSACVYIYAYNMYACMYIKSYVVYVHIYIYKYINVHMHTYVCIHKTTQV